MALLLTAGASPAQADNRVSAGTHVYVDTDQLVVVHPLVRAAVDVAEDTRIDVGYDADVISAATVDVRTSASVRPFEETRHGGRAGLTQRLSRTVNFGGGYGISYSPDYQSHALGLSLRAEDDDRVHTFGVSLQGSYASVGRVGDPSPTGELFATGLTGTWAGVLTDWLVADVALAGEWRHGYQESPYRFVSIYGSGAQRVVVPEAVPEDRFRGALAARLRAAVDERVFLRASYRFHSDDWGVVGHTVRLVASFVPITELRIELTGRILVQGAASFYRGRYQSSAVPAWRTRDRELASSLIGAGGVELHARIAAIDDFRLSLSLRGEVVHYRYYDTPLLPERTALVTGLTLVGEI